MQRIANELRHRQQQITGADDPLAAGELSGPGAQHLARLVVLGAQVGCQHSLLFGVVVKRNALYPRAQGKVQGVRAGVLNRK